MMHKRWQVLVGVIFAGLAVIAGVAIGRAWPAGGVRAVVGGLVSGAAVASDEAPWRVTDTLPLPPEKQIDKIERLSAAEIIADAIRAVFEDSSVSEIFDGQNQS